MIIIGIEPNLWRALVSSWAEVLAPLQMLSAKKRRSQTLFATKEIVWGGGLCANGLAYFRGKQMATEKVVDIRRCVLKESRVHKLSPFKCYFCYIFPGVQSKSFYLRRLI